MDLKEGLQLLPGTKKRLGIKVPGENKFLYIGSAILGAVIVGMFSLSRYETSLKDQVREVDAQLEALEQKRNKKDEDDLKVTKDRLVQTSELIKNHSYWTQGFSWIESSMQQEVQIKSLSASTDGKINMAILAANYTVVARQIASFLADSRVLDVNVGKIKSTSSGLLELSLDIKINLPNLIRK